MNFCTCFMRPVYVSRKSCVVFSLVNGSIVQHCWTKMLYPLKRPLWLNRIPIGLQAHPKVPRKARKTVRRRHQPLRREPRVVAPHQAPRGGLDRGLPRLPRKVLGRAQGGSRPGSKRARSPSTFIMDIRVNNSF